MTRDTVDRDQARADHETATTEDDQAPQLPPVAMVETMLSRGGHRNPEQIAAVLRAHPYAYREIMTLLNTTVGMRFSQFVMSLAQQPQAARPPVTATGPVSVPDVTQAPTPAPDGEKASTRVPQAPLAITSHVASPSEQLADDIARIEYISDTAHQTGSGILGSLVPGYLAARDQCAAAAVAELGGRLVGAYSVAHGAKAAFEQMLRTLPHHSVPGGTVEEDLAQARTLRAVEAKAPLLDPLLRTIDAVVASTMTPHVFRGHRSPARPSWSPSMAPRCSAPRSSPASYNGPPACSSLSAISRRSYSKGSRGSIGRACKPLGAS